MGIMCPWKECPCADDCDKKRLEPLTIEQVEALVAALRKKIEVYELCLRCYRKRKQSVSTSHQQ